QLRWPLCSLSCFSSPRIPRHVHSFPTRRSSDLTLPDLSAPAETGPAAFADPARAKRVLTDAGFDDVTVEPVEVPQGWGPDAADAATFLIGWGPMRHWLRDAAPDAVDRARAAATEAFRAYETDDGVRLMARHWLVTAVRPGGSAPAPGA